MKTARKAKLGRPRSEASRLALLEAAYGFVKARPVGSISTVEIARRAGVSTATIYRWWSTKESLLLDAFLYKQKNALALKEKASPLESLREYVLEVGRSFTGESGIVAARLLAAIQDNATLRKEFLERVYSPRDKEFRAAVKKAIRMGQLPADTEVKVFLETIFGPLTLRLLLRHEPIDQKYVLRVFNRVTACAGAQQRKARR